MRLAASLIVLALLPGIGLADASLDQTQSALVAAQKAAAAHKNAAAAAREKSRHDAAYAALLAEAQVEAAAKLRTLEEQTGGAASNLASLQAEQAQAAAALKQNEAALAGLLPVMQRLSAAPAATLLASPNGPTDSLRGILILQEIAGQIAKRAAAVQAQTQTVMHLLSATNNQQLVLQRAAANQRQAEDALTRQIADARAAETEDADAAASETAAAISADGSVRDLRGIIAKIIAAQHPAPSSASLSLPRGTAPVAGSLIEAFGDKTVAGPASGDTYKAAPDARVVAPCAGPVQFADHFQSYGLLVILDCGQNYLFVLSGMNRLDVSAGQRVARGQPVGEMQGYDARDPARQPRLYVELRRDGTPVDPAIW